MFAKLRLAHAMAKRGMALAVLLCVPVAAHAVPTIAPDGISYRLESQSISPNTEQFALVITNENTALDILGGRTGINAIALNQPGHGSIVGATMLTPSGFAYLSGGLNSSGCNGNGNFFCFDNLAIPPTPTTPLNGTLAFVFNVTSSAAGAWNGYATDIKVQWVGSRNHYDLVSLPIDVEPTCPDCGNIITGQETPEPSTYALLGVGLLGLGLLSRRWKKV